MKTQHMALPSLQAASVAFIAARGAEARRVFCANANDVVVPYVHCNGTQPAGAFFRFGCDLEAVPVGSAIDPVATPKYDAADVIGRQNAQFPPSEFVAGGFGKRGLCKDDEKILPGTKRNPPFLGGDRPPPGSSRTVGRNTGAGRTGARTGGRSGGWAGGRSNGG
ncbi:hypothetical protein CTA2_3225 [Colletotrichum tanaceti]|uniref:Uncharacterized protein n=1 Tax=Colletotrichum tanaceti TaxID=1306861 RepID=A0A4U6X138_9PEZI|nr:hypothetical protein CTA2_3225 [Colletotrichum tanaceti]TKW48855.1 hypothetical protein CTA1_10306 [Colletotrichum tanaceti]